jgi:dipeptidyl aminopeptidase/acylaminoacyl peptidase
VRIYQWSPDSDFVYLTASNEGATHLFRVSVPGGEVEQLVDGDVRVGGYTLSADNGRVIYHLSSDTDPGELWSMNANGRNQRQLTRYQDEFKNNVVMSVPEVFWVESFDGTMVQGWLMKPNPFEEGRKYPLIQTIHGGPHGAYGFSISPSNQVFAEGGYGVLYINPRGSTGYGQKFADGTINNWGGGDYQDLMAGLDYVIEHNDWIDEDRLGVMGGSYGGYMTNWVITQTDRFKAAVALASVSNLISFYGTSLYQLLIETEFPGELWDNYDLLWHWSPMKHVANVVTPTLFLHGEKDHDVPITQAEEMFVALKKLGVETVFVRYPGEGHGFRRSEHWQDANTRIAEWFDEYLEPGRIVRTR